MYNEIIEVLKNLPLEVAEAYITTQKGILKDSYIHYFLNGEVKGILYPDASEAVKHYDWWCVTDHDNKGRQDIVEIIPAHKKQETVYIAGGDGWRPRAHSTSRTVWVGEQHVLNLENFETHWNIPHWVGEKIKEVDFEPLWIFFHFPEIEEVTLVSGGGGYIYLYSQEEGLLQKQECKYLRFKGYILGDYETFVSPNGIPHKIIARHFIWGNVWFQTEEGTIYFNGNGSDVLKFPTCSLVNEISKPEHYTAKNKTEYFVWGENAFAKENNSKWEKVDMETYNQAVEEDTRIDNEVSEKLANNIVLPLYYRDRFTTVDIATKQLEDKLSDLAWNGKAIELLNGRSDSETIRELLLLTENLPKFIKNGQLMLDIPDEFKGRIIGKQGKNIQALTDRLKKTYPELKRIIIK